MIKCFRKVNVTKHSLSHSVRMLQVIGPTIPREAGATPRIGICAQPDERLALDEVGRFVGDFIAEQCILGYDRSRFSGGRVFIPVSKIGSAEVRNLAWQVSWRGTFDHVAERQALD